MDLTILTRRRSVQLIGENGIAGLITSDERILSALRHAQDARNSGSTNFEFLEPTMAAEIDAITAQIIPSGSSPGAREAGVIFFIDRALSTFDRGKRTLYRTGIASLGSKRISKFPKSRTFRGLQPQEQRDLLSEIDKSPFFEAVRVHTIIGFFANPSWGGNRDRMGWSVIGFEDRAAFEPPFGYYDDPKNGEDGL
jgi:gluconate 2-dehydrogenase gamma chain